MRTLNLLLPLACTGLLAQSYQLDAVLLSSLIPSEGRSPNYLTVGTDADGVNGYDKLTGLGLRGSLDLASWGSHHLQATTAGWKSTGGGRFTHLTGGPAFTTPAPLNGVSLAMQQVALGLRYFGLGTRWFGAVTVEGRQTRSHLTGMGISEQATEVRPWLQGDVGYLWPGRRVRPLVGVYAAMTRVRHAYPQPYEADTRAFLLASAPVNAYGIYFGVRVGKP